MLMVTVPPKTKQGNLSGTNSFRCHFIFHSSGSLDTRLHNGGVEDPPHQNTMLFMFDAFHVYEHGSHAGSATPSGEEDEDAKCGTEEEEEEEEEEEAQEKENSEDGRAEDGHESHDEEDDQSDRDERRPTGQGNGRRFAPGAASTGYAYESLCASPRARNSKQWMRQERS